MKKIRNWWNNFLKRLAKANKEQFGSNPPDCCGNPKPSEDKESKS